jgi:lipid II:glycine glycyltransferase (peptidoglycan interpeptide bridge formation enzyme)
MKVLWTTVRASANDAEEGVIMPQCDGAEEAPHDDGVATVVSRSPSPELLRAWDSLVQRTPGTDVTQLSAWARVRTVVGFSPLYLMAQQRELLAGVALILTRPLPMVGAVGYVPYGPVIDPGVVEPQPVRRALAAALRHLPHSHRVRMLFVQPPEGAESLNEELMGRGFRLSSAEITPRGSIRVDLTQDLADIRSRFGRRLRSWSNRWESRGVTVTLGQESDLPLLIRLMACTADRHGFTPFPPHYVVHLYRELAAGDNVALFIGRVHGVPVAADLVTICGDMVRGRLTGFDRFGEAARLSVPAAIRWHIVQWGRERGLRWLDFGGLATETLDALLNGQGAGAHISPADQPKLTFGGQPFRYPPAVDLVTPGLVRTGYDLAWRSNRGRRTIEAVSEALRFGSLVHARQVHQELPK